MIIHQPFAFLHRLSLTQRLCVSPRRCSDYFTTTNFFPGNITPLASSE